MASKNSSLSYLHRSAILLLSLDEETAAGVLRHMSPRDVQIISAEMAALDNISHDDMRTVLEDFQDEADQLAALNINSTDHIRSLLEKALGSERAANLMEDIFEKNSESTGIDALNLMEASMVSEMIREEHPQIIATILVHLDRGQAADVLQLLEEKLRNDVILRIATFSGVQPAALQELTEVLSNMLDGQNLKRNKMGGVHTAAEILNLMAPSQEEAIMESVRDHSEDLAQNIIEEMFLFDNLVDMDDISIQRIIKEIDTSVLPVALKGSSEALIDKFFNNMSSRAAQLLRDDMEMSGPVRLSQVEKEQKEILQIVRRLATSGEIALNNREDSYVG